MKEMYTISFAWDDEARVWIATSDDVPGLVLEHGSFDVLLERVRLAVPELLAMGDVLYGDISLVCVTLHQSTELLNACKHINCHKQRKNACKAKIYDPRFALPSITNNLAFYIVSNGFFITPNRAV